MFVRASVIAAAAGLISSVSAHAQIRGVFVNGVDKGDGQNVYIRSPPNNSPVKALDTPALNCNVNGAKVAPQFVSAAAGDTITTEWFHNTRGDDIIDPTHKGPVITYIAKFTTGDGSGPIWSKLDQSGLAADGVTWAVDTLIKNKGKYDFKLPSALAAGKYMVRQEIIAHHESDSPPSANGRGAQFYPSCIQFDVSGSGSAVPDQNFDFNTGYTAADPGILFNLFRGATTYTVPGPKVWTPAAGGNNAPAPAPAPTAAPTVVPTVVPTAAPTQAPVPTTIRTTTRPAPTQAPAPQPTPPTQPGNGGVGAAGLYQQCGGKNFNGPTACAQGVCKDWNPYYFQCIPN